MIGKIKHKGLWWLPDRPEKRISGTLKFTPWSGGILDLIGSFKDARYSDKLSSHEIILGTSAGGIPITLYGCFETKSRISTPGFSTSSFYVGMIFVGAHFPKKEDIKFKQLKIHYSHLNRWVNVYGFTRQRLLNFGKRTITVAYALPNSIEVSVNSCKISIAFQVRESYKLEKVTIEQKTYVCITYPEETPIKECLKTINQIRNFLTFAIGEPVYPLLVEGITEVNKQILQGNKEYYPPVKIFHKLLYTPRQLKTIHPDKMLFTFKDISKKFKDIIRNWFEKAELLEPIYDLYFNTLYNPYMYLHHRFLSLIQALEAYHRRVMKNYELPEEQHKKRLEEIIKAVSPKYKNWLENKLKYSNEPTLRKRLKDILDENEEILGELFAEGSFINKVVDTRNYLTHYDITLKERAVQGEELYDLTKKLEKLLKACILKELGFTRDEIKKLILSKNVGV